MAKKKSPQRIRKLYIYASVLLAILLAVPFVVIQYQSQRNEKSEAAESTSMARNKDTIPQSSPTPFSEFSSEMLNNGTFENGKAPWGLNITAPANASFGVDASTHYEGGYAASIEINRASSESKNIQLYQGHIPLISGRTFTLSFWAKSSVPRQIQFGIKQAESPNSVYQQQSAGLTTSWKQYAYTFNSPISDSNTFLFFNLAQTMGTVWIDNASYIVH